MTKVRIYNWLLCPRCKYFTITHEGESRVTMLTCKEGNVYHPMAMTGDASHAKANHTCPLFEASGKRGFNTRDEEKHAKRQKKQEESAKKNKIQHRKKAPTKRNKKSNQAFTEALRRPGGDISAGEIS